MSEPVARPTGDGGYVVGYHDPTPEAHHDTATYADGKPVEPAWQLRLEEVLTWSRWPALRLWAYRLAMAALAVAGVYGVLDGHAIAAWLGLASALFGVAQANVNAVPSKVPPQ